MLDEVKTDAQGTETDAVEEEAKEATTAEEKPEESAESAETEPEQAAPEETTAEDDTTVLQAQIIALQQQVATEKITNAMLATGVDAKLVQRAARMIDRDKVVKEGIVDDDALQSEIADLHKVFPGLVGDAAKAMPGFVIGVDANAEPVDKEAEKSTAIHKALLGR